MSSVCEALTSTFFIKNQLVNLHPILKLFFLTDMESISIDDKILRICQELRTLPCVMTPKQFMQRYIESGNSDIAYLRRYWAQSTGIDSTMELVSALRNEIKRTEVGRNAWSSFILQEVCFILHSQTLMFLNLCIASSGNRCCQCSGCASRELS
jgi:hypothetical protein